VIDWRRRVWLPTREEGAVGELIILGLTMLILAAGWQLSGLAEVSPPRLVSVGVGAIVFPAATAINAIKFWAAVQDYYLRRWPARRKAAASFFVLTLLLSLFWLVRGLIAGEYCLAIGAPVSLKSILEILIGGQAAMFLIFVRRLRGSERKPVRRFRENLEKAGRFLATVGRPDPALAADCRVKLVDELKSELKLVAETGSQVAEQLAAEDRALALDAAAAAAILRTEVESGSPLMLFQSGQQPLDHKAVRTMIDSAAAIGAWAK
jgi:hypothetical protein